ncbi:hypothetical protein [Streptomyces sp. XH2]|uniref:hypothetical protein n=1 Tax=Streptomyces sp. XH2 TaxID=3412483 RepID=UPI003C7A9D3D
MVEPVPRVVRGGRARALVLKRRTGRIWLGRLVNADACRRMQSRPERRTSPSGGTSQR